MKSGTKIRSLIAERPYVLRPCYRKECPNQVYTKASSKLCGDCIEAQAARQAAIPRRGYRRTVEPDMDSQAACAAVEQAFQQALQAIKRRPRGEPELRWSSPLAGIKGSGL